MNQSIKAVVLSCALPLALAACGKASNTNPVQNVKQAEQEMGLQGKIFRGDCSLKPMDTIATGIATGGDAAIKSARIQYEFVGANVTHATLLYATSDCTGDTSILFKETGSFDLDTTRTTADGGKYINLKYDRLTVTVGDDAGVKIAHDLSMCGSADWSKAQERDVTGNAGDLKCYRKTLPVTDANLYKLDGNTLYFGSKGLLDRNSTRPTSVDTGTVYKAD